MQDILSRTRVKPGAISAFVELHIEQGPLLEREGLQLGVVTAIAAPAALRVQFSGDGGHAGGQLMPDRYGLELQPVDKPLLPLQPCVSTSLGMGAMRAASSCQTGTDGKCSL